MTKHARSVEPSGFLGEIYPLMKKGKEGQALFVYCDPEASHLPKEYDTKTLLVPGLLYRGRVDRMAGVNQEEAQLAADTSYALIYEKLSEDDEMVKIPGLNTLRFLIALVGREESMSTLEIISTIPVPYNVLARSSTLVNLNPAVQKVSNIYNQLNT